MKLQAKGAIERHEAFRMVCNLMMNEAFGMMDGDLWSSKQVLFWAICTFPQPLRSFLPFDVNS
jgi:hypothetical protein